MSMPKVVAGDSMAPESVTRLRVLVVDDEKRLTDLLRLELDVEGYDVDVEQDGAGGLIRSRTDPTPVSYTHLTLPTKA